MEDYIMQYRGTMEALSKLSRHVRWCYGAVYLRDMINSFKTVDELVVRILKDASKAELETEDRGASVKSDEQSNNNGSCPRCLISFGEQQALLKAANFFLPSGVYNETGVHLMHHMSLENNTCLITNPQIMFQSRCNILLKENTRQKCKKLRSRVGSNH